MTIPRPPIRYRESLAFTAYPSCEDCLTWCEEGLAVAGGENVHIVGGFANGEKQSTVNTIRVDQFDYRQWPEQSLATIQDLSIGEEQSNSVVVALAWSPPGPGIHYRSVLAVLTSNLLLSIWETDGSQRNWQRTCVVNHHLPIRAAPTRRNTRIRCLAWSNPLRLLNGGQWGVQLLAIIDDDDTLHILRIDKKNRDQYGTWCLNPVFTTTLPHLETSHSHITGMTGLQNLLTCNASVRSMMFLPWNAVNLPTSLVQSVVTTSLVYQRHHQNAQYSIALEVNLSDHGSKITARQVNLQELQKTSVEKVPSLGRQGLRTIHSLEESPQWQEALKDIVARYDQRCRLGGFFRIRFWGFATSPDQSTEAACLTLHPWDMYEYTSTVLEKCHVVFRPLRSQFANAMSQQKTAIEVATAVLDFVISQLRSQTYIISTIDQMLVKVLHAWTSRNLNQSSQQTILGNFATAVSGKAEAVTNVHLMTQNGQSAQTTPSNSASSTQTALETCDICDVPIHMKDDNDSVCVNGHVFSRCSLSFISIQEPGISKYCSGCERQFLNISKLRPHPGQCITSKLFDEFDVCPYCRGRFRG